MAQTVTAQVKLSIVAARTVSADLETGSCGISRAIVQDFAYGQGDGQIETLYTNTVTLEAEASTLIMFGPIIQTPFAVRQAYPLGVQVVAIYSKLAANKVLTIGGGDTPAQLWWSDTADTIQIPPLGIALFTNPTGSGWLAEYSLQVLNASGGPSTFDFYVFA